MLIVVWEFVDRDLQQEDADDAWWKGARAPAPCIDFFSTFLNPHGQNSMWCSRLVTVPGRRHLPQGLQGRRCDYKTMAEGSTLTILAPIRETGSMVPHTPLSSPGSLT